MTGFLSLSMTSMAVAINIRSDNVSADEIERLWTKLRLLKTGRRRASLVKYALSWT